MSGSSEDEWGRELEDALFASSPSPESAGAGPSTSQEANDAKAELVKNDTLTSGKRPRQGEGEVCPPHPGSLGGICFRCGQPLEEAPPDSLHLKYIHQGLQISQHEAKRIRGDGLSRTLDERKLLLVLDLDHTLLNSTRFDEVSEAAGAVLQEVLEKERQKEEPQSQSLFRPFVRQFLEAANKIAEMCIYTHGDKEYAAAMASLLDPEAKYFHGRVISQADSTQRHVKDLDVMLGDESAVVILDDTEGVWPQHRDNLIQVERYIFFAADAVRFRTGKSLLERGSEESAEGGQLSVALSVLHRLHTRLFQGDSNGEKDVRQHLRQLKAQILQGVKICFTKVIPLHTSRPQDHPVWQLAVKLGASCTLELSEDVSHVVAGSSNTDKAHHARKKGLPVLSTAWIYASGFLWKRMPEDMFAAKDEKTQPKICSEEDDTKMALQAAGGGRGCQMDPP